MKRPRNLLRQDRVQDHLGSHVRVGAGAQVDWQRKRRKILEILETGKVNRMGTLEAVCAFSRDHELPELGLVAESHPDLKGGNRILQTTSATRISGWILRCGPVLDMLM